MKFKIWIISLLCCFLMGCGHSPAGFAPSASPIKTTDYQNVGYATGDSSYFNLLGFIPFGRPDYNAAINEALTDKGGGTNLINVRAWTTSTFVIIGTIEHLNVEGEVIKE